MTRYRFNIKFFDSENGSKDAFLPGLSEKDKTQQSTMFDRTCFADVLRQELEALALARPKIANSDKASTIQSDMRCEKIKTAFREVLCIRNTKLRNAI